MKHSDILLIGIKRQVVAISRADGRQLWTCNLGGGMVGDRFVTMICEGEQVFAYGNGHIHCLDLATGSILWSNDLPGLGFGLATLCLPGVGSSPDPAAVQLMMDAKRSSDANTT